MIVPVFFGTVEWKNNANYGEIKRKIGGKFKTEKEKRKNIFEWFLLFLQFRSGLYREIFPLHYHSYFYVYFYRLFRPPLYLFYLRNFLFPNNNDFYFFIMFFCCCFSRIFIRKFSIIKKLFIKMQIFAWKVGIFVLGWQIFFCYLFCRLKFLCFTQICLVFAIIFLVGFVVKISGLFGGNFKIFLRNFYAFCSENFIF